MTYPVAATFVVAKVMRDFMGYLAKNGTTAGFDLNMLQFDEFNEMIDLGGLRDQEDAYIRYAADFMAK